MTTSHAAPMRRWPASGRPAIEVEDPPAFRHDYPDLAEMAGLMLDSRRKRFPGLVAEGKMEAAAAAAEIAVFEELADHWRWFLTGEGRPASRLTILDRCAELDRSLRTLAGIAAARGGFDSDLAHQAHCVIALRWHADPAREHRQGVAARFNHSFRNRERETADAA